MENHKINLAVRVEKVSTRTRVSTRTKIMKIIERWWSVVSTVDIFSLLTTSNQEGYAEQATNADLGAMIGKAMEECYEDKCVIDVVVNLQ